MSRSHGHGGPHGHGGHTGHGRPHGLEVPKRRRLHRRLFLWFGATIALTGLVVGAVVGVLGPGRSGLHDELLRVQELAQSEYARAWHDPVSRRALSENVARALRADLTVEDAEGRVLEQIGARCVRGHTVEIRQGATRLGTVRGCPEPRRRNPLVFLSALGTAIATLWIATAFLARRLTRPLGELVRVTRAIGDGDLGARARLGHHQTGEVGALADSINEMAARIERQLREERELLAAVSHELRSPLARLTVLVELARNATNTEARLAEIEAEISGIDALLGKLLSSSRLAFDALDLQPLKARDAGRRALEAAGLDPTLFDDQSQDATLAADPTLLQRALMNLLENALHHGRGVERLVARAAGSRLCFEVEDRGPGFPPGDLIRAFDAFHSRGVSPPGQSGAGASLGLGLSLVARIARAHGGRAFAENKPSGGARVVLELPLATST